MKLLNIILATIWGAIITVATYLGLVLFMSCLTDNELWILFIPLLAVMFLLLPLITLIERK